MVFARRKLGDERSLYEYAIGALARRGRSVAEMKRLLRQRVEDDEHGRLLVEVVVARLKEERYLNDTRYATAYSSYRKEANLGRLRVISDLKAKGVHSDVIDKAVEETYSETNEERLAREFLRRKRLAKPADQRHAAKLFRTLARAGFTTRVIIRILKKWDVEDEVLTALQTEALTSE